ncbi:MAG: plasmid pRiA4b ORF-3 family protein [Candidatus Hydrogenedentota bacterium]
MSKSESRIYRFRVSLTDIEPEVWRIIDVPESYTFWDLHVAIQDAMGWVDYHLHAFEPDSPGDSEDVPIGIPMEPMEDEFVAGWTVPITRHFAKPGDTAGYVYDFGDGWRHEVELLSIEPRERGAKYPRCIDGERACPPEDCGGPGGYHRLLEILADPSDEEHENMVAWLKGHVKEYWPYHPEEFDPASVTFWDPKKRWKMMMDEEA